MHQDTAFTNQRNAKQTGSNTNSALCNYSRNVLDTHGSAGVQIDDFNLGIKPEQKSETFMNSFRQKSSKGKQQFYTTAMSKNAKTQYNWNGMLSSETFMNGPGNSNKDQNNFSGSLAFSGAGKNHPVLPEGRQTQTTMTNTTGTAFAFQQTLSKGFEEACAETNGSLLPQVATKQESVPKPRPSFGRNTLYNPKPQTDLLNFTAGDALATSAAAAQLVRPGNNKPESRRGSNNTQLTMMRQNGRQRGSKIRPNSRNGGDSSDMIEEEHLPAESTEHASFSHINDPHQPSTNGPMHNRRTDFPSRKAAGCRSAMSQVSSSMGSLGHLSLGSVNSQQKLKINHSKLLKLKSRPQEDEMQDMIEEEVELEQKEEQDSSSENEHPHRISH